MPTANLISPTFTVDELGDAQRVADTILSLLPGLGVIVVDRELRIVVVEGEVHGRHAPDPSAMIGRGIRDVLSAPAWEAVEGQWASALAGKAIALDWASLDGTADYMLQFTPVRDNSGDVVGAAMIAQDISERWIAYRRLERRAGHQAAITALGSLALRGASAESLMQEAARTVETRLGADAAGVLPYAAAGGIEIRGRSGETDLRLPGTGPTASTDMSEHLRREEGPLLIADIRRSALTAPVLEAEGMVCIVAAGIGHVGDRYGLLGACSRSAGAFSQDDLDFLQSMANVLAEVVARERADAAALVREAQLNEAQRLAGMGSWDADLSTGESTVSPNLRKIFGLDAGPVDFDTILACVHPDDRSTVRARMSEAIVGGTHASVEYRINGPDGTERLVQARGTGERDGDGRTIKLHGTVHDVTDQRRAEQALRRSEERFRKGFDASPIGMTLSDPATGRFLQVNPAYCRFVGRSAEELLTLAYTDVVHPDDLTSTRTAFAEGQTDELITEARYVRPDGSIVWASINAARVLGPDGKVDVLFSQMVDVTERRAREEATLRERDEVIWVQEIVAALAEDRFELHAQPIIDLATGDLMQHELLLRMRTVDGALVAPGEFLPAAERYGVIRDIDSWVIARGAELAAGGMNVEINISGTSMGDPELIDEIDRALERTGAEPSRLVFEITETAVIEDMDTARRLADRLRMRGCRFALDDFGTGFGGISSLKTLPLDFLKIDREFVRDLRVSETDKRVVSATIDLARAFGLQTIAEGVEDEETLDLLRELGVDHAQGFFLGRPAPIGP